MIVLHQDSNHLGALKYNLRPPYRGCGWGPTSIPLEQEQQHRGRITYPGSRHAAQKCIQCWNAPCKKYPAHNSNIMGGVQFLRLPHERLPSVMWRKPRICDRCGNCRIACSRKRRIDTVICPLTHTGANLVRVFKPPNNQEQKVEKMGLTQGCDSASPLLTRCHAQEHSHHND